MHELLFIINVETTTGSIQLRTKSPTEAYYTTALLDKAKAPHVLEIKFVAEKRKESNINGSQNPT